MPVLGLPLLLVGLAALPMVAGIYWLRTRFRRQEVSTLFLWRSAIDAQGGGRKKNRMQTPLALLLELLAILLLVLAATAPRVLRGGHTAVVTVVLDDSYSMTATDGAGNDARQRAIDVLRRELDTLRRFRVRLVAAGGEPRVLGEPVTDWPEVQALLDDWECASATADLGAAVALATEIGGPRQRLLVLSDHPMPAAVRATPNAVVRQGAAEEDAEAEPVARDEERPAAEWGRLRWVSVGRPSANLAIINAVRSPDAAQGDKVLIELANLSETPASATLTLSRGAPQAAYASDETASPLGEPEAFSRSTVPLPAGETKRVWLRPEAAGRPLIIAIGDDALAADNHVVLMPAAARPLPVAVELGDAALARAITQAVEASGRAKLTSPSGALLKFTDSLDPVPSHAGSGPVWSVRFDRGANPAAESQAYLGPFVIDFDHPLAEGLSLAGLVWAVGPEAGEAPDSEQTPADTATHAVELGGRPVVSAGNVVLLRDDARRDGTHRLTWRLRPEESTWLQSAALPIVVWNLIDWRQSERPGVSPVNVRPGVPVSIVSNQPRGEARVVRIESGQDSAPVADLDGAEVLPIDDRRATWVADRAGAYAVVAGGRRHRVAVNAGSAGESDLRGATEDEFGVWDDQAAVVNEYHGLAWVLGLLALGVLGLHAALLYRQGGGPGQASGGAGPGRADFPGADARGVAT
ncbi:MAG: VWA domain-containing protein [Planctomycetota bacterium]